MIIQKIFDMYGTNVTCSCDCNYKKPTLPKPEQSNVPWYISGGFFIGLFLFLGILLWKGNEWFGIDEKLSRRSEIAALTGDDLFKPNWKVV